MADATPGPGPESAPSLTVLAQYLKDLSFENPKAPASFSDTRTPQIAIDVNVNAKGFAPDRYEVELSVTARAHRERDTIFVVETTYAGAFEIRNMTPDQLEIIMLVECPRLLFPFVRQILADATRNGNYAPMLLEPIDFFAVYQQNQARARTQGAAAPAPARPAHA